jgi:hypothetical protein
MPVFYPLEDRLIPLNLKGLKKAGVIPGFIIG